MTAVSDFMNDTAPERELPVSGHIQTLDGGRLIVRGSQNLLGAALFLSAIGLWVMPGSDFSGGVLLMKLVLSLTAAIIGLALIQQGRASTPPEVEIDTVRREIRLVRINGKARECIKHCKFADLDRAEVHGAHVALWDKGNVLLAEVALSDPKMRRSIMSGLADAGKL